MIALPPARSALVLIDLQKGVLAMPGAPHAAEDVLARSRRLAERFRAAGSPVVLVNVGFSPDFGDMLSTPVDRPPAVRPGGLPAGWSDLADGLAEPSDLRITKRQWGAFHGTDLDLQLRRRGVVNLVLGGIATNIGVESTARAAHEQGYAVVLAEDAASSRSAEMHAFAVEQIFPLLGRVAKACEIVLEAERGV